MEGFRIGSIDKQAEAAPLIEPKTAIGVDVGLKSLVAMSTGETIQYP